MDWSSEDFVTVVSVEGACVEEFVTVLSVGGNAPDGAEEVLVYRLPGERLGFGLKFEGGTSTNEKVRRLFIQSCAPDSPASRANCSWGSLQGGDEVLQIDSAQVSSMTRLDCVRCLKESNVVIKLLVRHSPPPVPPRRKSQQAVLGPPTAFADVPPEAEVYLDLLAQEEEELAGLTESESDDTGSSISTVVAPLIDLAKVLSPFEQLERELEADTDDSGLPLQPPLSFQDAPLSYGDEKVLPPRPAPRKEFRSGKKRPPPPPPPRTDRPQCPLNVQNISVVETDKDELPRLVDVVPKCIESRPAQVEGEEDHCTENGYQDEPSSLSLKSEVVSDVNEQFHNGTDKENKNEESLLLKDRTVMICNDDKETTCSNIENNFVSAETAVVLDNKMNAVPDDPESTMEDVSLVTHIRVGSPSGVSIKQSTVTDEMQSTTDMTDKVLKTPPKALPRITPLKETPLTQAELSCDASDGMSPKTQDDLTKQICGDLKQTDAQQTKHTPEADDEEESDVDCNESKESNQKELLLNCANEQTFDAEFIDMFSVKSCNLDKTSSATECQAKQRSNIVTSVPIISQDTSNEPTVEANSKCMKEDFELNTNVSQNDTTSNKLFKEETFSKSDEFVEKITRNIKSNGEKDELNSQASNQIESKFIKNLEKTNQIEGNELSENIKNSCGNESDVSSNYQTRQMAEELLFQDMDEDKPSLECEGMSENSTIRQSQDSNFGDKKVSNKSVQIEEKLINNKENELLSIHNGEVKEAYFDRPEDLKETEITSIKEEIKTKENIEDLPSLQETEDIKTCTKQKVLEDVEKLTKLISAESLENNIGVNNCGHSLDMNGEVASIQSTKENLPPALDEDDNSDTDSDTEDFLLDLPETRLLEQGGAVFQPTTGALLTASDATFYPFRCWGAPCQLSTIGEDEEDLLNQQTVPGLSVEEEQESSLELLSAESRLDNLLLHNVEEPKKEPAKEDSKEAGPDPPAQPAVVTSQPAMEEAPLTSSASRLPPDGHEFPPNYTEHNPFIVGSPALIEVELEKIPAQLPVVNPSIRNFPVDNSPLKRYSTEELPLNDFAVQDDISKKFPIEETTIRKLSLEDSPIKKFPLEDSSLKKYTIEDPSQQRYAIETPIAKKSLFENSTKVPVNESSPKNFPVEESSVMKLPVEEFSQKKFPLEERPSLKQFITQDSSPKKLSVEDFSSNFTVEDSSLTKLPLENNSSRNSSFEENSTRKQLLDEMPVRKISSEESRLPIRGPAAWRKDEKSERSVRDKIAMFSSSSSSGDGPATPRRRFSSTEDVYRPPPPPEPVTVKQPATPAMDRTHSSLDLSYTPGQYSSTLPRKPVATPTTLTRRTSFSGTNLQSRSQSLIDIGRGSMEDVRKASLNALIEQRRRGISKLRGLVIPEKVSEISAPSQPICDLPEIRSRDSILSSSKALSQRSGPANKWSATQSTITNTAAPVVMSSPPWKTSSNSSNLPKYSPAFKRKSLSVYGSTKDQPQPLLMTEPPASLESITSPTRSDLSFDYKSPAPNKTISASGRRSLEDDSDNDSAVSSSRSSISPPPTPPPAPLLSPLRRTLSSETTVSAVSASSTASTITCGSSDSNKRVLKAQSVEAINRKNVLSSARYSSGRDVKVGSPLIQRKFDEEVRVAYLDEVEGPAPEEEEEEEQPPVKPLPAPRRTPVPPKPMQRKIVEPGPEEETDLISILTGTRRQRSKESLLADNRRSVSVHDIRKAFEKAEMVLANSGRKVNHARVSSLDSTASEDSFTPHYGSSGNLQREQFGSVTSIASSTSLISPQELQVLIDEANQPLEDFTGQMAAPVQDVVVVVLHREGTTGSVGITLAGGADYEAKEITVHKVLAGSPADRDGRIQKGDRILSINGRSMKGVSHRESLNILKAPRPEVVLVVSRSRGFQDTNHDGQLDDSPTIATHIPRPSRPPRIPEQPAEAAVASLLTQVQGEDRGPPVSVSLTKDGAGLGFSLEGGKDSPLGDKPLTIKKIFTGGSAEKNGQLRAGDELLNVNGSDVTILSRIEAWSLMKRLPDGPVVLTVRHRLNMMH